MSVFGGRLWEVVEDGLVCSDGDEVMFSYSIFGFSLWVYCCC